jgi:DNA repair protein RadC
MDNNLNKGHRLRIKERFIRDGFDSYSPHQVMEMLLFYAIPQKDTNELAHRLLDEYGSISGVFGADYNELSAFKGLGPHAAILIKMMPEIAQYYAMDRWKKKPQIRSVNDAGQYAVSLFIGKEVEAFYMICLNAQNKVVFPALISEGTINEAMIYPRTIVENAFRHHSATVIFAHNHPGGSTEPSVADIDMTKKLKTALEYVSIRVMDHVIVAGNDYLSMAHMNYI